MLNQVVLVGNLGRDPETRYSASGMAITTFSMCFKSGKDKDGWVNVVLFNKLAESAGEHLHKGARIGVIGVLDENKWEDGQGNKKRNLQIIGNNIEYIRVRDSQKQETEPQGPTKKDFTGTSNGFDNFDIPF